MGQNLSTTVGPVGPPLNKPSSINDILAHAKETGRSRYAAPNVEISWHVFTKDNENPLASTLLQKSFSTTVYVLPGTIAYDGATTLNSPKEFMLYGLELDIMDIKLIEDKLLVLIVPEQRIGYGLTISTKELQVAHTLSASLKTEKSRVYWTIEESNEIYNNFLKERALRSFRKHRDLQHPLRYAYYYSLNAEGNRIDPSGPWNLIVSLYNCYRSLIPSSENSAIVSSRMKQTNYTVDKHAASDARLFWWVLKLCCNDKTLRIFLLTFRFDPKDRVVNNALTEEFFKVPGQSKPEEAVLYFLLKIREHFKQKLLLRTNLVGLVDYPIINDKVSEALPFNELECKWFIKNRKSFESLPLFNLTSLKLFINTNGVSTLLPISSAFLQENNLHAFRHALTYIPPGIGNVGANKSNLISGITQNIFHPSLQSEMVQEELLKLFANRDMIDDEFLNLYVTKSIESRTLLTTEGILKNLFFKNITESNTDSDPLVNANKTFNASFLQKLKNPCVALVSPLMNALDKKLTNFNPDAKEVRKILELAFRLTWTSSSIAAESLSTGNVKTLCNWLKEEKVHGALFEAEYHQSVKDHMQKYNEMIIIYAELEKVDKELQVLKRNARLTGWNDAVVKKNDEYMLIHNKYSTIYKEQQALLAKKETLQEKYRENKPRVLLFSQLWESSNFPATFAHIVCSNSRNFLSREEKEIILKEIRESNVKKGEPEEMEIPPMPPAPANLWNSFTDDVHSNAFGSSYTSFFPSSTTATSFPFSTISSGDFPHPSFPPPPPPPPPPPLPLRTSTPIITATPPLLRSESEQLTSIGPNDWNKRKWVELFPAVYGVLVTLLILDPAKFIAFLNSYPKLDEEFFVSYFRPEGELRLSVLPFLMNEYNFNKLFVPLIEKGIIFNKPFHFSQTVLDTLSMRAEGVSESLFREIVLSALKIEHRGNLRSSVQNTMTICKSGEEYTDLFTSFIKTILDRERKDFFDSTSSPLLTLEDLQQCTDYAKNAMQVFEDYNSNVGRTRLLQTFEHYRKNMNPDAWISLFRSSATVAMIMKYIDREDLALAKSVFDEANEGNQKILDLLKKAGNSYPEAFVTAKMMDVKNNIDSEELISKVKALGIGPSVDIEKSTLVNIFVAWMKICVASKGTPIAPRNSQVLTMLLCAHWLQIQKSKQTISFDKSMSKKALIGRVGTGEGKSLIIAMLAVYAIKVLNIKQVYILEHDSMLLNRDYNDFQNFYEENGLKSTKIIEGEGKIMVNSNTRPEIVYCVRRALESMFQEATFVGKKIFSNCILIVDEVDSLIVDESPNSNYVKKDVASKFLSIAFSSITKGSRICPPDIPPLVWSYALDGYTRGEPFKSKKDIPEGWSTDGNDYFFLDKRGNKVNLSGAHLEYIKYIHGKVPEYNTCYIIQCIPHMFSRFDGIIGLSGSLGSKNEKNSLERVFGSDFFITPPFLDTCVGTHRNEPVLVNLYGKGKVSIHDPTTHAIEVGEFALSKHKEVPVLIICKNVTAANEMYLEIIKEISPQMQEAGVLQQFYTVKGVVPNDKSIVKAATERLRFASDGTFITVGVNKPVAETVWPITITDYTGGRGHDYNIHDRMVDQKGGLLVIATAIAETEREWVQWLGRTARNDRHGQYAVMLSLQDEPVLSSMKQDSITQHYISKELYPANIRPTTALCKEKLIDEFLSIRDEDIRSKITDRESKARIGRLLNELSEKFYMKHKGSTDWPQNNVEEKFRDFLDKYKDNTILSFDDVAKFAEQEDINLASPGTYRKQSEYVPSITD